MFLLKGLLRNKKVKLGIIILSLLLVIMFVSNELSLYYQEKMQNFLYERTSFLLFANENHEDILNEGNGVKSYQRVLYFNIGENNDIMYNPRLFGDYADLYEDELDESKIMWKHLQYNDLIMGYLNSDLKENEVILYLQKGHYNSNYLSYYIGKEITFDYYGKDVSLVVKDIITSLKYDYICISDKLYNQLVHDELKYIYDIETVDYESFVNFLGQLENLETNSFFKVLTPYYSFDTLPVSGEFINCLDIIYKFSFCSFFIGVFYFSFIVMYYEKKEVMLLRIVGFNRWQNMGNVLRNMLVLDSIVFILSIVITGLITFILNYLFKFEMAMFNLECLMLLSGVVLFAQFLFSALFIKKC